MADIKTLLELVGLFCTTEQIKVLLRQGKRASSDKDAVRITAETKEELIDRNLRAALDTRAVSFDQAYNLIRDAEENGGQHVYYYKVPKTLAAAWTLENVGALLWGANWQKKNGLPNIKLQSDQFIYSDFRQWNPEKKPLDWVVKVYGHEFHEKATGKVIDGDDGRYLREFEKQDLRIVLLARFNHPDLLEIRIQADTSRKRMDSSEKQLWGMLSKAVDKQQLNPWDLRTARTQMVRTRDQNSEVYTLRGTRLTASGGERATFESQGPSENLFETEEVCGAVDGIINKGDCTHLGAIWRGSEGKQLDRDLTVLLGDRNPNELIVSAACSRQGLDYVTNQLRYFSRQVSEPS